MGHSLLSGSCLCIRLRAFLLCSSMGIDQPGSILIFIIKIQEDMINQILNGMPFNIHQNLLSLAGFFDPYLFKIMKFLLLSLCLMMASQKSTGLEEQIQERLHQNQFQKKEVPVQLINPLELKRLNVRRVGGNIQPGINGGMGDQNGKTMQVIEPRPRIIQPPMQANNVQANNVPQPIPKAIQTQPQPTVKPIKPEPQSVSIPPQPQPHSLVQTPPKTPPTPNTQPQSTLPATQAPKKQEAKKALKYDFFCGSGNIAPPLPPFDHLKDRAKPVRTNYGFNMYVDSKDTMVSNVIATSGTWEPGYVSLVGNLVKPGNNVLNLGSQSGLEALVMGKKIGPTGKLFIFEPYSFSNQLVTKNVQMNELADITTIYKVGASDQKGTAVINIAYINTGGSEIIPMPANKAELPKSGQFGQYSESEEVVLDRVDALLPEDIKLDFALLDVQKMEIKALKGMKKIIERSPNLIIMCQWQFGRNPRANRQQTLQLLQYMVKQGYKMYSYSPSYEYCKIGSFHEFSDINQLLRIDFMDVFFIPVAIPIPK